jgi:hypothetical protein
MPTFLIAHHFPKDFQGSPETAAAAKNWFERLGANVVSRTNQAVEPRKMGDCGGDPRRAAYEFISVDSLDAALAWAEAWPLLTRGGGVEVWELTTTPLTIPVPA